MPSLQEYVVAIEAAEKLDDLVEAAERLAGQVGGIVLQSVLAQRAAAPTSWPECDQRDRLRYVWLRMKGQKRRARRAHYF